MFNDIITSTPYTDSDLADQVFENIRGDIFWGDKSFVATLRALISLRIESDEIVTLRFCSTDDSSKITNSLTRKELVYRTCRYIYDGDVGTIYIHSLTSTDQAGNRAVMRCLEEEFTNIRLGYKRLKKITDFYRKQFECLCYINPECKSVVIFAEGIDLRKWHYLQCSIPAFLPWYFDPEKGISGDEMELMKSLREKTCDKYVDAINKLAEKLDLREKGIEKGLGGIETVIARAEKARIERAIETIRANIDIWNSSIGSALNELNKAKRNLMGVEAEIEKASGDSEIMNYFLCNRSLDLLSVDGSVISFGVKTHFDYFDEGEAEAVIRNKHSCIYTHSALSPLDTTLLMRAVFVDRALRIKTCAAYRLDLVQNVTPISHYDFGTSYKEYIPNTHIQKHGCLGNYIQVLNELMEKGDYVGALEQCVASCKSLNFGDSIVLSGFVEALTGNGGAQPPCIELPTGGVVTANEAVRWLKENKESEENNE